MSENIKNFIIIEGPVISPNFRLRFNPEYLKYPECSEWNIVYNDQEVEVVSFSEAAKKYALNDDDSLIFKPKIIWIKCKETKEIRKIKIELKVAYKTIRLRLDDDDEDEDENE